MRSDIKKVYVCRNVVPATPGTWYAYFLAQVMPKFTENSGMTFNKKWTYWALEIHRNGNESTFRRNIGHSDHLPCTSHVQMTCPNSKYDMSKSHVHISHVHFKFAYKRKRNIGLEEKCKKSCFLNIELICPLQILFLK